jgi:hypothetical protein
MENQKLVEYARRFLRKQHPLQSVYPEQAAAFSAQLRAGCHQDLLRLITRLIKDTPDGVSGKEALHSLGCSINEGSDINLWGMPDCACKKPDCVYCGTGMATT